MTRDDLRFVCSLHCAQERGGLVPLAFDSFVWWRRGSVGETGSSMGASVEVSDDVG